MRPAEELLRFCAAACAALLVVAAPGWLVAQAPPGSPKTFSPAGYVRLFEDTGSRRILIYDPTRNELSSSQIKVDGRSTIYIVVAKDLINQSIPMNRLFMTATLARGNGQSVNLGVIGYSEVGKAAEGAESQKAVGLQTAADVRRMLMNMYFTTEDLIRTFYGGTPDSDDDTPGCPERLALDPRDACGRPDPELDSVALNPIPA